MNKFIIFTLIFTLFFGFFSQVIAAELNPIATVKTVNGKLMIRHENSTDWAPAVVGQHLYAGDELRTGETDQAAILFIYGSQLKLNYNTVIKLQGEEKEKSLTKRITMAVGEIWAKVNKEKGLFQVETPTSVATVKGTILGLKIQNKMTILDVFDGIVELANAHGSILVEKNNRGIAEEGNPPIITSIPGNPQGNWQDDMNPDWGLSIVPGSDGFLVDQPSRLTVKVFDLETGVPDLNYREMVEISTNSADVNFSIDNLAWTPSLRMMPQNGELAIWTKSISSGTFEIFANALRCQPAELITTFASVPGQPGTPSHSPSPIQIDFQNSSGEVKTLKISIPD